MDFVLKSGAKLTVSVSPFEIGNKMRKAFRRIGKVQGDLLADDEMEDLFFLAAQKAIYAGSKVNKQLFDDLKLGEQARGDYDEIFENVLDVNLSPFFPKAASSASSTGSEVKA